MSTDKTTLGDICKSFEDQESNRAAMKGIPLLARLDGISFHTFTRGLERPFHPGLCTLMQETTKHLVSETHCLVGYTQSDEITLVWFVEADSPADYMHGGRFQKLCSRLAAIATAKFNSGIADLLPEKDGKLALFDCRVWQVPTLRDAYKTLLWREQDATKNSITMAASSFYSHNELHGKRGDEKQEMLWQKGVNWNDYPDHFKRGSYFRRKSVEIELSPEELDRIPEDKRPQGPVIRSVIERLDIPPISQVPNVMEVLFG